LVPEGKSGGNVQIGFNEDAFGADNIWVILALTEGGHDVIVKEIDLQVRERDLQIVDSNQKFGPRLSEHDVWFVIQIDELVERS
jgi:hypothetical protein